MKMRVYSLLFMMLFALSIGANAQVKFFTDVNSKQIKTSKYPMFQFSKMAKEYIGVLLRFLLSYLLCMLGVRLVIVKIKVKKL